MYREARKHQLACSPNEFLDPVKDRDWLFDQQSEIPSATPPTRKRVFGRKTAGSAPSEENNVDFAAVLRHPRLAGFSATAWFGGVPGAHLQTDGAFFFKTHTANSSALSKSIYGQTSHRSDCNPLGQQASGCLTPTRAMEDLDLARMEPRSCVRQWNCYCDMELHLQLERRLD